MDWRIKAVIQGVLSRLPGGASVNDALQRIAGGRRDMRAHVESKFKDDWLVHAAILRDLNFSVNGRELVEIGTGWLPVFPLCFALAGARRCFTFDLHRHLNPSVVPNTLRRLESHLPAIAQACAQSESVVHERWERLMAVEGGTAILEAAGVVYCAPADATSTGLEPGAIALVFSNSVLEHVASDVLAPLMRESSRILRADGLSLHSVNCGDHYAYFDRSITPIHYLRFSERQWRHWNNALLYQNRLRPVDFVDAARGVGMDIVLNLHVPRAELMQRVEQLPIAPEFRHYSSEQLCSTSVTFAARAGSLVRSP